MGFTKDMSIEEILEIIKKNGKPDTYSGAITETMAVGQYFLQFKLHQESLAEQQKAHKELVELNSKSQKDNLTATTWLVLATWALVVMAFLHK